MNSIASSGERDVPPPVERWRRYRDVVQALRCGLRDAAADLSFLRLRGLRCLLKMLRSVATSDSAIRLFQLSQTVRELQVVPVLFENNLRKKNDDCVEGFGNILSVERIKLKTPATDSETTLALRVLEGCCLLCKDSANLAYRYDSIKVLTNILSSGGMLEQRACLDALISLLVNSPANEMDFKEFKGVSKVAELMNDKRRDHNIRLKCAEFLLIITGNAYEKGESLFLACLREDIKQSLGEKCSSLVLSINRLGSTTDLDQRQTSLTIHAQQILELLGY